MQQANNNSNRTAANGNQPTNATGRNEGLSRSAFMREYRVGRKAFDLFIRAQIIQQIGFRHISGNCNFVPLYGWTFENNAELWEKNRAEVMHELRKIPKEPDIHDFPPTMGGMSNCQIAFIRYVSQREKILERIRNWYFKYE